MGKYLEYWYDGKLRNVGNVRALQACDIFGCCKQAQYQVQFKDGMWIDVCEDHKPIKNDGVIF